MISPVPGARLRIAMSSALVTRAAVWVESMEQPTTRREQAYRTMLVTWNHADELWHLDHSGRVIDLDLTTAESGHMDRYPSARPPLAAA
jgi:hypothetical protein